MNIGIDATPLRDKLTGVGNYVYYLLRGLVQKRPNDHFYLYAIKNSTSLELFEQFPNVTIRIAPLFGFSEAFWSQTTLAWLCYKDSIDLFWGSTQSIPLFAQHKSLITIYDFAYKLYPETVSRVRGTYLRLFGKFLYKKADCITTISFGTAERLHELYGLKANKVIIPPLKNLSVNDIPGTLKKHRLKYKDYFLMVGTLEPRKNIVTAIKAYKAKCPLVLVGGKGWRDHTIIKEITNASKIVTLGYLPDDELNALVVAAKAYVMPSLYEGYGMPVAEARVLGTPVVCCNVPEMVEAAEGDALVVEHDQLEKAFTTPLKPPKKPTYPSNDALVTFLSEELLKLS